MEGPGAATGRRLLVLGAGPAQLGLLGAARELQFELAARIRDEISELKKELRAMDVAGVR